MDEQDNKIFEDMVIRELDACGYFLMPENKVKKSMHQLIMDFACLYCMENYNKNYNYYEAKK